jgi:hypothetical protein
MNKIVLTLAAFCFVSCALFMDYEYNVFYEDDNKKLDIEGLYIIENGDTVYYNVYDHCLIVKDNPNYRDCNAYETSNYTFSARYGYDYNDNSKLTYSILISTDNTQSSCDFHTNVNKINEIINANFPNVPLDSIRKIDNRFSDLVKPVIYKSFIDNCSNKTLKNAIEKEILPIL